MQVTLPKVPVALSPQKQQLLRQQNPVMTVVSNSPPTPTSTVVVAATTSTNVTSSWASPSKAGSASQTAPAVVVQSAASLQRVWRIYYRVTKIWGV